MLKNSSFAAKVYGAGYRVNACLDKLSHPSLGRRSESIWASSDTPFEIDPL
jgi:hypothetical protein